MRELVSILIPAYNSELWISDAVESALSQTWPHKEIIIVNDGSTDSTLDVAKRFESKHVKVVSQENGGASSARNTALRYAQGNYIQWLDADDLLAPDKLSQQLGEVENGADNNVLLSASYGEFHVQPCHAQFAPNSLWQDLTPIEFLLTRFDRNLWTSNCAWLVSRRLTDLAGPWDERLTLDDDGEYFARVVTQSERIKFVPEARVFYRRGNVGSLSRSVTERACESLLLSLTLCFSYLLSMEDSARTRAASLKFLQTCIDLADCFHPDKEDLFGRVCELGRELGGELRPPRLSWKYRPIRAAFGWKAVRKTKTVVSKAKLLARLQRDRFLLLDR